MSGCHSEDITHCHFYGGSYCGDLLPPHLLSEVNGQAERVDSPLDVVLAVGRKGNIGSVEMTGLYFLILENLALLMRMK